MPPVRTSSSPDVVCMSRTKSSIWASASSGGRMTTSRWTLPALACALAALVWAIPLQLGIYADAVITDIPVYQRAYDAIAGGNVPYADFSFEYPPLAAGLFWLAGVLPGSGTAG